MGLYRAAVAASSEGGTTRCNAPSPPRRKTRYPWLCQSLTFAASPSYNMFPTSTPTRCLPRTDTRSFKSWFFLLARKVGRREGTGRQRPSEGAGPAQAKPTAVSREPVKTSESIGRFQQL